MAEQFDLVIVGGGLVGSCLAYALKQLPLRIGLIEAREFNPAQLSPDQRAIALTYGSQCYLAKLGLWPSLANKAMPITQVHVSDRGHFGMTRFAATEFNIPALGYVLPFNTLQQSFQQAVAELATVIPITSAQVIALAKMANSWQISVQTPTGIKQINAGLVIAADGGNSTIRKLQNIPLTEWDYQQTAILAHIELHRSHRHIAYERFTANGAVALLPYTERQAAIIWTIKNRQRETLLALDDNAFLRRLQQEFGYRAGRFLGVSPRQCYPLKMLHAQPPAGSEVILIGNAAHTLHPIAAQGFNLGLRDVAALADLIIQDTRRNLPLQGLTLNQAFLLKRQPDQQRMIYFTDSLTRIFANDFLPLTLARNLGLASFNFLPALRHRFAQLALGIIRK